MTTPRGEPWLVAAFFLGVLSLLLISGDRLLGDPDTYWHIVTGQRILATFTLPVVDTYSHSFAGQPWIAKEWLSQVLLAAAYEAGGWRGVVLLTAAVFAATFAMLLAFLLPRLRVTAALVLVLLAFVLVAGQILARPNAFFHLVFLAWCAGLAGAVERQMPPPAWLLVVMVLWANLHASFPIGILLAALFALQALGLARPYERPRVALRWGAFVVLSLLAACLTPYGAAPLLLAADFARSNEMVQHIAEFRPLEPGALEALAILLPLLGFVLVALHGGLRPALAVLAVLPCLWLMFRHARFASLFALAAPVALAAPLAQAVPTLAPYPLGRWRLAPAILGLFGAICLLLAVLGRPAPSAAVTPVAALDAALAAGASGPVLNSHNFGGYLIWRGIPTFIDGRTDQIFRGGFSAALFAAEAAEGDADFRALLDRHGIAWALVEPESGAAEKLSRTAGWRRIHADPVAAAFLRE